MAHNLNHEIILNYPDPRKIKTSSFTVFVKTPVDHEVMEHSSTLCDPTQSGCSHNNPKLTSTAGLWGHLRTKIKNNCYRP